MELERGQTVYLYLQELDDDTGDPENYLGRFPAGTEASVVWVTENSHRGLDVEVEVYDDEGGSETFSVSPDEIATSLAAGPNPLLASLRESLRELREAETDYSLASF